MSDQQQPQPAPMTATRLAEIRKRVDTIRALDTRHPLPTGDENGMRVDVATVDALLAFTEAALPILRAVANGEIVSWSQNWVPQTGELLPRMNAVKIDERICEQARALLAGGDGAEGSEQ